jgi:hypothetical protein
MPERKEPEFLFHYTSFASFLAILQSATLLATAIQYLNDSQELLHAIDLARNYALLRLTEHHAMHLHDARSVLTEIEASVLSIARVKIFQFSFSEEDDLLSQWRAYCPNGGVSFGVRRTTLSEIAAGHHFRLVQCVYDLDQQLRLIAPIMDPVVDDRSTLYRSNVHGSLNHYGSLPSDGPWSDQLLYLAPKLKHLSFQEEREWRLVSNLVDDNDRHLGFHATPTSLVPHFELDIREAQEGMPIERVVVGPHPHKELLLNSVREALRLAGRRNFEVRLSRIPYRPL